MNYKTLIPVFVLIIAASGMLFFILSHPPTLPDYRLQLRLIPKNYAETKKTLSVGEVPTEYELFYLYDWKNKNKNKEKAYLVEKKILMDARFIIDAYEKKDPTSDTISLIIKLDHNGSRLLENIKEIYVNRRVAIIVDGKLISTLVISNTTESGFIELTNIGSPKIIQEVAALLRGMPVRP
jgi:preprotein translocase subunit SecD